MATPIGHALAGYVISRFTPFPTDPETASAAPERKSTNAQQSPREQWYITLLCVFMAMAPDLDLLPGLLQGKPILYHGGISHSLAMGLFVSLLVALFSRWLGFSFRTIFVLGFSAYASHLLLDMLGPDGREPYGIPLFWPLADATYLSPTPLLLGVHHASSANAGLAEFLRGAFSLHNVAALLIEMLLILSIWMSIQIVKRRDSVCLRLFPEQIRPNSHNRRRKKSYISEKRTI